MFLNITYWSLKLIRLTNDSHSMFSDPRFLSYSALMKIGISFKAILSSVHKSARFRKQAASWGCLLY